jgi:hypothetical protein
LRGRAAGSDLAPPTPSTTVWAGLDATIDGAAARFAAVVALLPDGPLALRVRATEQAVATCVADARRLIAVGTHLSPDGTPTADVHVPALLAQITALVRTIDAATREVVALHLEVHEHDDPVAPLTLLNASWTELSVPGPAVDGDAPGRFVGLPLPESDQRPPEDPTRSPRPIE